MPVFLRLSSTLRTLFTANSTASSRLLSRLFAFFRRPKPLQNFEQSNFQSETTNHGMHLTAGLRTIRQLSSQRVPMIKFIGHHGAVPRYDPSKTPASSSSGKEQSKSGASRAGAIVIDELELPFHLRRRLPDAEEIAMINNGGLREG
ncbi:hypothetical protein M3Y94_00628400 [Aphelenchoides besseyi]|nr:hypothetical protein M3Y94_00628400 [Aphelenchoides besseyi]